MSGPRQAHVYAIGGMTWWVISARYPTPALARAAWERLEKLDRSGRLELGCYRHGPREKPGLDVTVVSHRPEGMEAAERELFNGPTTAERVRQEDDVVQAMVIRRARVMAGELGSRKVVIRRGTRGAFLHPDGSMEERIGGDG